MEVKTINHILSLGPGNELNGWVDRLVFNSAGPRMRVYAVDMVLHFSSDISDAMLVEEEMRRKNYRFALSRSQHRPRNLPAWRASFCKWGGKGNRWFCDDPCVAICKAACIAMFNEQVPVEDRYKQVLDDDQSFG